MGTAPAGTLWTTWARPPSRADGGSGRGAGEDPQKHRAVLVGREGAEHVGAVSLPAEQLDLAQTGRHPGPSQQAGGNDAAVGLLHQAAAHVEVDVRHEPRRAIDGEVGL